MKKFLGKAVTYVRDSASGRRRLARYTDPEAHRRDMYDPDSAIVNHYIPGTGRNQSMPF